jgi:hypothetical protein
MPAPRGGDRRVLEAQDPTVAREGDGAAARRCAPRRTVRSIALLVMFVVLSCAGCADWSGDRPVRADDEEMAELQRVLAEARPLTDLGLPPVAVPQPAKIDRACPVADGTLLGQPQLRRSWTLSHGELDQVGAGGSPADAPQVGEVLEAAVRALQADGWERDAPGPGRRDEPPSDRLELLHSEAAGQRLFAMLSVDDEPSSVVLTLTVEASRLTPCSGGPDR